MNDITLHQWSEIQDEYHDCLLLGNGASMAINEGFGYRSLLETARGRGLITPRTSKVFEYFETTDFESVMMMLAYATNINAALEIDEDVTKSVYRETRDGLINAVRYIHPDYTTVRGYLWNAARFMGAFSTVVSLNYDLTGYWAMLYGNKLSRSRLPFHEFQTTFKDCFDAGRFRASDWSNFRKSILDQKKVTLVFYPHGNLVFARSLEGEEIKISAEGIISLLETVVERWSREKLRPLFISEGTTKQKQEAIFRSSYLSTVYNSVLPHVGRTIAIYGWSLGDNDQHILEALFKGNIEKVAVSVRNGPGLEEKCSEMRRKIKKQALERGRNLEPVFFDADSAGCWIHLPKVTETHPVTL
jgi:hypothetical protein